MKDKNGVDNTFSGVDVIKIADSDGEYNNYVAEPKGDLSINENGSYDVKDKASVTVSVQGGIIEVETLPTENIDGNALYKMGDSYYKFGEEFKDLLFGINGEGDSFKDVVEAQGTTVNLHFARTRPTENIKISIDDILHLYFVYDENDVLAYGDFDGKGTNEWKSIEDTNNPPFVGPITDKSQITEYGFYALVDNGWKEYLAPKGILTITENGTYDVTDKSQAVVNVEIPDGYINPNGVEQKCEVFSNDGINSGDFIEKVKLFGDISIDVTGAKYNEPRMYKIDDKRFIFIGRIPLDDGSNIYKAFVVSVDENGYSFGQQVVFAEGVNGSDIAIEKVRENVLLCAFGIKTSGLHGANIGTIVLTIDGLEISVGELYTITTIHFFDNLKLAYLQDNKLLIAYIDVSQYNTEFCYTSVLVLTINGTQISSGAKSRVLVGVEYGGLYIVGLDSQKVFLAHNLQNYSQNKCCIVSIDGTTATFGNQLDFPLTISRYHDLWMKVSCNKVGFVSVETLEDGKKKVKLNIIRIDNEEVILEEEIVLFPSVMGAMGILRLKPMDNYNFLCWIDSDYFCTFNINASDFSPIVLDLVNLTTYGSFQLGDLVYFDDYGFYFTPLNQSPDEVIIKNYMVVDNKMVYSKEKKALAIPANSKSKNVGLSMTSGANGETIDGIFC